MSYSNISYALPQADIDAVKAAINTINSKLPFLVSLSADERHRLFKLGPKSADFVSDCKDAVNNFAGIFPPTFNAAEFKKDADLVRILSDLLISLDSLTEKVNDTLMAVGSEAMAESLDVYSYVQTASGHTPGLKSVSDKLKDRFRKAGKKKSPNVSEN